MAEVYEKCLTEVCTNYRSGGFKAREVHYGNEFHKVMESFAAKQDPPIHMNYAAAQDHVPSADWNNQTIQE